MRPAPFLAAAVLAAAATTALPAAASAPTGSGCTFHATNGSVPGQWWGQISGGPVAAPGSDVSITCEIHVGNDDHLGAAAVSETSATTPGAAALEPRLVGYEAEDWELVTLCTSATVDGTRWYLVGGGWSQTAGTCTATLWPPVQPWPIPTEDLPPVVRELVGYVICLITPTRKTCDATHALEPVLTAIEEHVDPPLCALLVQHAGVHGPVEIKPDGDVYVADGFVWDCPPYELVQAGGDR